MKEVNETLQKILPRVVKPGQYVGGEINSIEKQGCNHTFALGFADTYEIGMSNHGLRILYEIINQQKNWSCERVFCPLPDMEKELRQNNYPLKTIEQEKPLAKCDIISFSLQYELGLSSVFTMLDLGGVPLKRTDRTEESPLIIAGGHATFNPEPFSDFFDLFFIGEGEEGIVKLLDLLDNNSNMSRNEKIVAIATQLEGFYAPALYETEETAGFLTVKEPSEKVFPFPVKRQIIKDFANFKMPIKPVVPVIETVHERVVLEIMRGCPNGCRFCQAGIICRPVRERSVETLQSCAKECFLNTGYDEIGLMSLSTSDYSDFENLVATLDKDYSHLEVSLSLPSLRVNHALSDIPKKFKTVRKSGLTLAPEAGTDRLRKVINKDVTDENLLLSCEEAFKQGWKNVKLYFMVGLPTETDEDVIGIAELANKVARLRKGGRGYACTVSVSNFIPKPFTPFQWEGMDTREELLRKHKLVAHNLRSKKIDLKCHNVEGSFLEGVFSRGDRRLGKVALNAWKKGARLEAWTEHFRPQIWAEALQEEDIDGIFYASSRRDNTQKLPWSHIDSGINIEFLKNELKKAEQGIPTPRCDNNSCAGCGVESCQYLNKE